MPAPEPAFSYRTFSRFVEVFPVGSGLLVVWGRYEDQGASRLVVGQRVYTDLIGVRSRLQAAVFELTKDQELVQEALILFDRSAWVASMHGGRAPM